MTLSEEYQRHAFADLIEEAEKQGIEIGVKQERKRIIKLLKPLGCEANGVEHDCQNGLGYTTAADLIELIKGEQK